MNVKSISHFGLLTALALVLGYVERLIPVAPGIPGIKLGLANTVLLYAVYLTSVKQSALLMVLKVLLSGFLFAGLSGMLFSFAGGALSLLVMLLIRRIPGVSIVGVSLCGAFSHNIGQILAASLVVEPRAAFSYLPVLLISGLVTGFLTGIAAKYAMKGLEACGLASKAQQQRADLPLSFAKNNSAKNAPIR